MGYQQRRRKAKKKYRYSENGKKKRIEAERRRRLRIPSGKNKKDKGIRKKKQLLLLSAKQNNPTTISVNKVNRAKISKRGGKNQGKKKSTKGYKEACHLCGAEGVIVKRISWNCGKEYPYYSFRIKRRETVETSDTNIGKDKRFISRGIRLYWQKE
ncbi:MAG: hypothetical protein PVH61_25990 [Candidatus Aminicenantes bacterium]